MPSASAQFWCTTLPVLPQKLQLELAEHFACSEAAEAVLQLGTTTAGTDAAGLLHVQVLFQMHPNDQFRRLFEVYCAVVSGMDVSHVTFTYQGVRIHGLSTPRQIGVHSGDVLQVLPATPQQPSQEAHGQKAPVIKRER